MDNRRLLLAVVLSMAVVALWSYLFPPPEPSAPPESLAEQQVERAIDPAPPPIATRPSEEGAEPPTDDEPDPAATEVPPVAGDREERIVLEAEGGSFEFSNRGAQLVSYRIPDYTDTDGRVLDLIRRRDGQPYPFALLDASGQPSPLNDALFAVERSGGSLTFRYRGPLGEATKRFTLGELGLMGIEVEVAGAPGWQLMVGPGVRGATLPGEGGRFARRGGVYRVADDVERPTPKDSTVGVCGTPAADYADCQGLAWVGLEDTYFLAAVLPESAPAAVRLVPVSLTTDADGAVAGYRTLTAAGDLTDEEEELNRSFLLEIVPAGERFVATTFWGAKRYDTLAALPRDLEKTVNLGFFDFLARPLMIGLEWIYENVVANYGWAIVLMTIFIRILMLPLTHHSTVSMRKMQELNPKMQAIRQRYSGKLKDKQGRPNLEAQRKMNDEIMGLYKSEGVNPAGGCLPILLQMPVFFAFYQMLYNWVELLDAPWILWITDLSAKDPYYVLPLVMGASQFLQQRMMPATGNPMQRRIMMLMPVFFLILFLQFPSGLVLYWLTNNVLGIAQQWVYNHLKTRSEAASADADPGRGKPPAGKPGSKRKARA